MSSSFIVCMCECVCVCVSFFLGGWGGGGDEWGGGGRVSIVKITNAKTYKYFVVVDLFIKCILHFLFLPVGSISVFWMYGLHCT